MKPVKRNVKPVQGPQQYGRQRPVAPRRKASRFPTGKNILPWRFILVVVSIGIVILLISLPFKLQRVVVNAPVGAKQIETKVRKITGRNIFQNNIITLSDEQLAADILSTEPNLRNVTVMRLWPNGIRVDASIKEPGIGWISGGQAYLLDLDGNAIGALPSDQKIPTITDNSNLPVTIGTRVTTARFVSFVTGLAAGVPATGLTATKYDIRNTTFDLYLTTSKGYYLIFDTQRPAADSLTDLSTILTTLNSQKRNPAEYIDLRVKGKAYYK